MNNKIVPPQHLRERPKTPEAPKSAAEAFADQIEELMAHIVRHALYGHEWDACYGESAMQLDLDKLEALIAQKARSDGYNEGFGDAVSSVESWHNG